MKNSGKLHGSSLLLTLAFVVIITITVVGFAEMVRIARPAAASYLERARAREYSRSAIDRVVATLRQTTADPRRSWITQPGQIVAGSEADDEATPQDERKLLAESIALHSGTVTAGPPADPVLAPPNLNLPTYRDPSAFLLTEQRDGPDVLTMSVQWIYVRQSGDLDLNQDPVPSASDPIVGRYAYWTDDESSKINYNIAWGRAGNTNVPGHPTQIELTALPGLTQAHADTLHNFITGSSPAYNFFNTPLDARRIETTPDGAGVASALKDNKFDVTHFNSDPNTTFFNEPRIVLTTRPDHAGWTKNSATGRWEGVNKKTWEDGGLPRYLRVLKDPEESKDPGLPYTQSLDPVRLAEVVAMIAFQPPSGSDPGGYLQRNDWPMASGSSLQEKYFGHYPTTGSPSGINARTSRLGQLAVNIIDYVRAKESTRDILTPIIGYFDTTQADPKKAFALQSTGQSKNGYAGLSRVPLVTEMGVWYGKNTGPAFTPPSPGANPSQEIAAGANYYVFKIEVFLPPNYGLPSIDLEDIYMGIQGVSANSTKWRPNYPTYNTDTRKIDASEVSGGTTVLQAVSYAVISRAIAVSAPPPAAPPATTGAGTRIHFSAAVLSTFYQFAPIGDGLRTGIPISTGSISDIKSLETDDPRLNQHPDDWVEVAGNSFGERNSRWSAGQPASGLLPEQDTDVSGVVSDASLYMPPPKGKVFTRADGTLDDNAAGKVASVGELGFIHTGYEPGSLFDSTPIPAGVSWRTLRLQPSSSPTNIVPDWAVMDLFTAPVTAPNAFNRLVYAPHETSYGGRVNLNSKTVPFEVSRVAPLAAVMQNAPFDSENPGVRLTPAQALDRAGNIFHHALAANGKNYGSAGYDSPGEVVEVEGIADRGEKSEELVRQIMNLVSTRGNTFSVYSVGQALKQTPSGKLAVTAEQRYQATIERYADPDGGVHFSPVYLRSLTP